MKAGDSLKRQLVEAIRKCDICIFIATRASVESKWCLAETGAFWGAGKRIILFKADSAIPASKLPPLFEGDLWISDVRTVISQAGERHPEVDKSVQTLADSNSTIQLNETASLVETNQQAYKSEEQLPTSPNNFDMKELEGILNVLAQSAKPLNVQKLGFLLHIQVTHLQLRLDALEERKLVQIKYSRFSGQPTYCLSKKGREYVVANELV